MFEPNNEEALCCGNGLMCIADYLHGHYRVDVVRIMTEIPFEHPRVF
jgi:diaminopimelate epimerase